MSEFKNGQPVEYKIHCHNGGQVDYKWIPATFIGYNFGKGVIEFSDEVVREYNLRGNSLEVHDNKYIR